MRDVLNGLHGMLPNSSNYFLTCFNILPTCIWKIRSRMASLCVFLGFVTLSHAFGELNVFLRYLISEKGVNK